MPDLAKLVELKNQQRAATKAEYWKQITNPNSGPGTLFDPAIQRVVSQRVTKLEHFRETPKNLLSFCIFIVFPIAAYTYVVKKHRDEKEALYRSGAVAYKDRLFKFA